MHDRRSHATYKVKDEILKMAHRIFHRSSKDPKKEHVSQKVHPSPVKKHARDHGKKRLAESGSVGYEQHFRVRRNQAKSINQGLARPRGQGNLIEKREHV